MIRCGLVSIIFLASLFAPAAAQERVTVGALRLVTNGALFLAAGKGYFKQEGLDVEFKFYPAAQPVAAALAAGEIDLGATAFTAELFNLAGKGAIKVIAAQAREKRDFEGNEILASNAAYAKGLRKPENLSGHSLAITQLGSSFHYQIGQIARLKRFDLKTVTLKPLQSLDAMVSALAAGQVDAAILPVQHAREMLMASQAKLVGWYSELDEQQLGGLFATAKIIQSRRETVDKFVRAYQRGAADFAAGMLRRDRYSKRVSDVNSRAVALVIARYIYPSQAPERAVALIESSAYYVDAQARLDVGDVYAQIAWYKSQGLVEASVDARNVLDLSFVKGHSNLPK